MPRTREVLLPQRFCIFTDHSSCQQLGSPRLWGRGNLFDQKAPPKEKEREPQSRTRTCDPSSVILPRKAPLLGVLCARRTYIGLHPAVCVGTRGLRISEVLQLAVLVKGLRISDEQLCATWWMSISRMNIHYAIGSKIHIIFPWL